MESNTLWSLIFTLLPADVTRPQLISHRTWLSCIFFQDAFSPSLVPVFWCTRASSTAPKKTQNPKKKKPLVAKSNHSLSLFYPSVLPIQVLDVIPHLEPATAHLARWVSRHLPLPFVIVCFLSLSRALSALYGWMVMLQGCCVTVFLLSVIPVGEQTYSCLSACV